MEIQMNPNWSELTPEEKLAFRVKSFLKPSDITFSSPRAETDYKNRADRLYAAIRGLEPDRVPVTLPIGNFPAYYAGKTLHQVMYDYDALREVYSKFMVDFYQDMDTFTGPMLTHPGRVLEFLDIKLMNWPGHGLGKDATTYQFVEGEYMNPDEYDTLINDPSDFFFRKLAPRIIGAMAPLKNFCPLSSLLNRPMSIGMPLASPDIRRAFQALINAGIEQEKWLKSVTRFNREAIASGFPSLRGGMATAPFDTIGDSLRGTRGVLTDILRRPDKILAATNAIAELTIEHTIEAVNASNGFMVFFPLHKGDDTHMSLEQFEIFYWPSLRKVVLGLIEEGIMVTLFAEGRYGSRLERVNDFPKGWVIWHFDQTDMRKAKNLLGGNCCLMGNVPSSLMVTATSDEVKQHCRELIEICGQGGGYILAGGCSTTESKEDNLRAMMLAAVEYGRYQ
jgi:uroporphyrinogen-III decarboxylase